MDYLFSRRVSVSEAGDLAGFEDGTIWTPDAGSLTGDLAAIGERLKTYTLAKPDDRDKVRLEIRDKARLLKARLDRPRPTE